MAKPERVGVGVGVVVFDASRSRMLLGCRRGSHGAGTWALPGGWLEKGESFEACALRELEEETGLCAEDVSGALVVPVVANNIMDQGVHSATVFVRTQLARASAADSVRVCEPHKCTEWRWVELQQERMPTPLFPPLAFLTASAHWRKDVAGTLAPRAFWRERIMAYFVLVGAAWLAYRQMGSYSS
jgi:ADP-ribose pyrophosphatase YjhB (NUDIX family)